METVYAMFAKKVQENPGARAVYDADRQLSRAELDRLADTIAGRLPLGVKRVGIVMDHSVEMIAAILAVLKLGAAYVPAEPSFPDDRIRFMLADGEVSAVITNPQYAARLAGFDTILVERGLLASGPSAVCRAASEDLAYILYTSGSTGKPKGVAVRNRNVCHYVKAFCHEFRPDEADTMLQYSVCSFDIFVEEVFAALLSGAALAIPSAADRQDIGSLMAFVERHQVTMLSGFPYLLLEMNHLAAIPSCLRLLISGGDVLRAAYIDRLLPQADIYNTYGPSETTVCTAYYHCNGQAPLPDGTYPVGKAVLGSKLVLLDRNLEPVAAGKTGEICILGGGVAVGYTGNRQIENQAFVTQPDGQILYRSGDMGYVLPDGNIAFLHRKDTQVMILGKRVETAEVESVLCQCPEIKKAVVKAYSDEKHLSYLVAYIVMKERGTTLSVIRQEMARFLPEYMIPEFFVRLQDLPLNANGKVDGKALPVVLKEGLAA